MPLSPFPGPLQVDTDGGAKRVGLGLALGPAYLGPGSLVQRNKSEFITTYVNLGKILQFLWASAVAS